MTLPLETVSEEVEEIAAWSIQRLRLIVPGPCAPRRAVDVDRPRQLSEPNGTAGRSRMMTWFGHRGRSNRHVDVPVTLMLLPLIVKLFLG